MENNFKPSISRSSSDGDQQVLGSKDTVPSPFNIAIKDDILPITGIRRSVQAFAKESKTLWYLAAPAICTTFCQYSFGAITQTFAGHVGSLELAAFSIENSVIAGLSYGVMTGMASALGTLCGQAYGAGQIDMLGIYMQRSWIILLATSVLLMSFYIFAEPFMILIGQKKDISRAAGKFALWMIPQLYAYAINAPTSKFLLAQSKIAVMAWISVVGLALHTVFSWLLMIKLGWGMVGGALVLNTSWWFVVVAQLVYIFCGRCGKTWSGFELRAFQNLWDFTRFSFASALMLCLESWYFMAVVLFAGYLKNAEIAVDAFSICSNILGWTNALGFGVNSAISVRVGNELGAARPRAAKFSIVVAVISSFLIGLLISIFLLIFRGQYPYLFIDKSEVEKVVYELTPLLAVSIIVNIVQFTLSGVAVGAGWQALIGYVNIACYYIFGLPLGLVLGYVLKKGVQGIWYGMVAGTTIQMLTLFFLVRKTNWNKEASSAAKRVKEWGGEPDFKGNEVER